MPRKDCGFATPALLMSTVDGAEFRLRRIEGARDLGAISDVGNDRERMAARGFDLGGERLEPFLAPRHEHDARAVLREHEREACARGRRKRR